MISRLPPELLILIAEHLKFQEDRYHLAVTCHKVYVSVLPVVYSKVSLGMRHKYSVVQASCFLYAVLRHPELANAVRSLSLGEWETRLGHEGPPFEIRKDTWQYDAGLIRPLLMESPMPEELKADWNRDLEKGITDAWLALILPQLTRLRKISIEWPASVNANIDHLMEETWFFKIVERASVEETPILPHLEEAHAWCDDSVRGFSSDLMLPFFNFPSMRLISAHAVEESSWGNFPIPFTSGVTAMYLNCYKGTEQGLLSWIGACKALEIFGHHFSGYWGTGFEYDRGAIIESLLGQKASLESITLSEVCNFPLEGPANSRLGSLHGFTVLKHLHVGLQHLVEVDENNQPICALKEMLPSSLESLYLYDCGDELFDWAIQQLESLVASKYMPNLAKLKLESKEVQKKLEGLAHQCKTAGISLTAVEESFPRDIPWDY